MHTMFEEALLIFWSTTTLYVIPRTSPIHGPHELQVGSCTTLLRSVEPFKSMLLLMLEIAHRRSLLKACVLGLSWAEEKRYISPFTAIFRDIPQIFRMERDGIKLTLVGKDLNALLHRTRDPAPPEARVGEPLCIGLVVRAAVEDRQSVSQEQEQIIYNRIGGLLENYTICLGWGRHIGYHITPSDITLIDLGILFTAEGVTMGVDVTGPAITALLQSGTTLHEFRTSYMHVHKSKWRVEHTVPTLDVPTHVVAFIIRPLTKYDPLKPLYYPSELPLEVTE
jgi:hypothetical protein